MAKQITNVPRVTYSTTTDALDSLWAIVNGRRKGSKNVTVPVDTLVNLLTDHSKMAGELDR